MAIYDTGKGIEYARGDNVPITFTIQENGAAVDVTGYSFIFTVNTERNPVNTDNEQFLVSAIITDAGRASRSGLAWTCQPNHLSLLVQLESEIARGISRPD